MNLLMVAPMCDSRGKIRYFIGAQADVSGLVKECSDMESLARLVVSSDHQTESDTNNYGADGAKGSEDVLDGEEREQGPEVDEFRELSEMLNLQELNTVRKYGGNMHREPKDEVADNNGNGNGAFNWNKPRLLIHELSPDGNSNFGPFGMRSSGKLSGVYQNYLLVRPYPSLRILFASPSLRMPGILQSPFMSKIGGSHRVREELTQALGDGRGVTAKIRWVTKLDPEGRGRWIHCTPLLGSNGAIGVWMVIIVDDEDEANMSRKFRQAPPVDPMFGRHSKREDDEGSLRDFAHQNGAENSTLNTLRDESIASRRDRSESPYTLSLSDTR
jgi:hypothetical protein